MYALLLHRTVAMSHWQCAYHVTANANCMVTRSYHTKRVRWEYASPAHPPAEQTKTIRYFRTLIVCPLFQHMFCQIPARASVAFHSLQIVDISSQQTLTVQTYELMLDQTIAVSPWSCTCTFTINTDGMMTHAYQLTLSVGTNASQTHPPSDIIFYTFVHC